jgi:hypothetical protein
VGHGETADDVGNEERGGTGGVVDLHATTGGTGDNLGDRGVGV